MGNFICSVILLTAVILFAVINSVIICNICGEMIDLAESGNISQAVAMWQEYKYYISYFVRDAEIDVVSAEADALGDSIELEDGEAEIGALRFKEAVTEIINSEKMTFGNVF